MTVLIRQGALELDTPVPDEPISVATWADHPPKWISNFDNKFKGIIPARQALAESRNAVAIWIIQQIGIDSVLNTARDVGIRTALHRYETTALGASEVTLLELANAYRLMASGIRAEPYVIAKIEHNGGAVIYSHPSSCCSIRENELKLSMIQERIAGRNSGLSEWRNCGKGGDAVFRFPNTGEAADSQMRSCRAEVTSPATSTCDPLPTPQPVVCQRRDGRGRIVYTNE